MRTGGCGILQSKEQNTTDGKVQKSVMILFMIGLHATWAVLNAVKNAISEILKRCTIGQIFQANTNETLKIGFASASPVIVKWIEIGRGTASPPAIGDLAKN